VYPYFEFCIRTNIRTNELTNQLTNIINTFVAYCYNLLLVFLEPFPVRMLWSLEFQGDPPYDPSFLIYLLMIYARLFLILSTSYLRMIWKYIIIFNNAHDCKRLQSDIDSVQNWWFENCMILNVGKIITIMSLSAKLWVLTLIIYFFPVALQSVKDLGRLTCRRILELFRHMVGLFGRVISPSQGLYLHRTS
jgi:hypothetical protein